MEFFGARGLMGVPSCGSSSVTDCRDAVVEAPMLVCHSLSQKEGRTEMKIIFIALWLVAFVAFVKCERHLKRIADRLASTRNNP